MAARLHLDRSAISKIEHGDYNMHLFRVIDYCIETGIKLSDLIKEFESPPPIKIPNGSRLSSILAKKMIVIAK